MLESTRYQLPVPSSPAASPSCRRGPASRRELSAIAPCTRSLTMSTAPLFPGLGPKIKAAYKTAVAKGAVLFTESEEVEVEEEGIPVASLLSRALACADLLRPVRDSVCTCSRQEAV